MYVQPVSPLYDLRMTPLSLNEGQIDYSATYPAQIAVAVASIVGIVAMLRLIRRSDRRPVAALVAHVSFMATVTLLGSVPVAWLVGYAVSYNLGVIILLGFMVVAANAFAVVTFLTGLTCSVVALRRSRRGQTVKSTGSNNGG